MKQAEAVRMTGSFGASVLKCLDPQIVATIDNDELLGQQALPSGTGQGK